MELQTTRHVAVISPGGLTGAGGMAQLVRDQISAWRPERHGASLSVIDSRGVGSAWCSVPRTVGATWQIVAKRRGRNLDLVHVHMASWSSMLRKAAIMTAARRMGVPVLLHLHASDFEAFLRRLPESLRHAAVSQVRAADRVVAVGRQPGAEISDLFGLDPGKVVTVHNGVPAVTARCRRSPGSPPHIVFLGRFEPAKGIRDLIAALASESVGNLDWRATLAGTGNVSRVRKAIASAGLSRRVALPGWVSSADARHLLAGADIYVQPSHREGLSIALLEAMAAGCGIVATDVGATREAVENAAHGLVVKPGAPDELAGALSRLIGHADLCRRLGEAARARQQERFSIDRYCDEVASQYRALIDSRTVATTADRSAVFSTRRPRPAPRERSREKSSRP